jgi:uncharacterized membrane protein YfcA
MFELFTFSLSLLDLLLLVTVAVLIGMAKTGIAGAGMIAIPLLAITFGGKASTGLILPILIFADLFAIYYFHRHANWQYLRHLLPFAFAGVLIGTYFGNVIEDQVFVTTMVVIIFISLGIMIWQETNKNPKVPTSKWFGASVGVIGGFASMVGNLAGPVMALYLLLMRLPKNQFIGTAAWFFLLINLAKVPFHIAVWETITLDSFLLNLLLLPGVALGAWLGVRIVQRIPEKAYRVFVIAMTAVAAVAMLF